MNFAAYALVFLVGLQLSSCVELPDSGPQSPDYRSSLRFVNAGRGIDTIAINETYQKIAKRSDTTTTVPVGGVSYRTIRDTTILYATYHRLLVNFQTTWEVLVDGASWGSVPAGEAQSPYRDVPSGTRKIKLSGTAPRVDQFQIRDTSIVVQRDTIVGGIVTKTGKTLVNKIHEYLNASTGTSTEVIDSTATPVTLGTQKKATIFLMGDTTAAVKEPNHPSVRYGRMLYRYGDERYTFAVGALPDTTLVRFTNASVVAGDSILVRFTGADTTLGMMRLFGSTPYRKFASPQPRVFNFSFNYVWSTQSLGEVRVNGASMKRYSVVLMDSSNVLVFKTYLDE